MSEVLLFGGTSEGRELAQFLSEMSVRTIALVASCYGENMLSETDFLQVRVGRLNEDDMLRLFKEEHPRFIIDATHPYATQVTANIKAAVNRYLTPDSEQRVKVKTTTDMSPTAGKSLSLLKVERPPSRTYQGVRYFEHIETLLDYLNQNEGKVFVTTGSKMLERYVEIENYQERLTLRLLPSVASLTQCLKLGFSPANLIMMQGPFTRELNLAFLRRDDYRFLVTKEAGARGGFNEKIAAAQELGLEVLILKRPQSDPGLTCAKIKQILKEAYQ
ncbi:MAG TPA: precorrin-6A/cobalt-precorrin-6A reductase [Clostridiaceae bacterium]|nr:precorrin-6A/cobalt-precorrin-6A reductase [Clostridiaceae bacterium]